MIKMSKPDNTKTQIRDHFALTPREQQLMDLINQGKDRKEISEEMGIARVSITRMLCTIKEKQQESHWSGR